MTNSVLCTQPPGVSNTLYDCTYDNTASTYLDVEIDGDLVTCGTINEKENKAIRAPAINDEDRPKVTLNGAIDADYYTVILSASDDDLGDMGPIIHMLVGNVLGSDLKAGVTLTPSGASEIIGYFGPNPPFPFR